MSPFEQEQLETVKRQLTIFSVSDLNYYRESCKNHIKELERYIEVANVELAKRYDNT